MAYLPPTTHITPLASLERDRVLPTAGEVLVQEGQRVDAATVVARAGHTLEYRLLDIARMLEVPVKQVEKLMVKQEGEEVKKDEPLARKRNFIFTDDIRSPVEGSVLAVGEGKALLAVAAPALELKAGMPGQVVKVAPNLGVVIATTGALVQGVWGNGAEAFAVMQMLETGPREELTPEHLSQELRDSVLAIGVLQNPAALKKFAEVRLRGLIVGSLSPALYAEARKLEIPVIVTDGFGAQGFSPAVYALLQGNVGRELWLNAQTWNMFTGHRPEIIIPLPSPGQPPPPPADGEVLAVGHTVRVTRGAETGSVGQVLALSEQALYIVSGVRTLVAYVKVTEPEPKTAAIPFANLEILE